MVTNSKPVLRERRICMALHTVDLLIHVLYAHIYKSCICAINTMTFCLECDDNLFTCFTEVLPADTGTEQCCIAESQFSFIYV